MFDVERTFRRLQHLMVVNKALRASSLAALNDSDQRLQESSMLMAACLSAIDRAETRRRASGSSVPPGVWADGAAAVEVVPALIQLGRIRRRFMHEHDRDVLIHDILDAVTKATKTDLGNIQLVDPRRGTLKIVAQQGFGPEFLGFFGEVRGEEAACGAAMRARRRMIVEDVATHPIFLGRPAQEVLLRAGVQAVQSTPLIVPSGELVGVISTHFRSPHRVPIHRLRLIDIATRQFAALVRDSSR